jgi:hypothetical protein
MASHEATEAAFRVKRNGTQHAYDVWWAALETEAALWAALPNTGRKAMNGCGCWCFECTNRNAGWHCHGPLCEDGKSETEQADEPM